MRPMRLRKATIFLRMRMFSRPTFALSVFCFIFTLLYSYPRLQAIHRYIKGRIKKESATKVEKPKPKKLKKIYTIRDIIKHHYRSRVMEEIPFKPTDRGYLGSYQKAVTKVLNNMSEKDLEEAENIQESWNKEGGPSEIQLK